MMFRRKKTIRQEIWVTAKLREIGKSLRFRTKSQFRVRPYPNSWRYIVIDHVWLTSHPVEAPIAGFEVTMRGREFSNSKKMRSDIVSLQLLRPNIGILVVNEKEAKEEVEKWYEDVDSFKEFLKTMASPMYLEILDIEDIMKERVPWGLLLKKVGLKLRY